MNTWSQPFHDTFVGMASLCFALQGSAYSPTQIHQTLYNFLGDAGCVVCLLYIFARHHCVLWNRALPAMIEYLSKNRVWPGPLRHRQTRRKVFKGCRDTLCITFGLVALFLLLTNSAAPPSPLADKWFAASPKSHWETAADKQAAPRPLVHQHSLPYLQPNRYMATDANDASTVCPTLSFADSCIPWMRNVSNQTPQQSQPNAAATKHAAPVVSTSQGIASRPAVTSQPAASAHTTAVVPALSRSLMLVPGLPMCQTTFPLYVLAVEAQHTLVVHPYLPMFKSLSPASAHRGDSSSMSTPAAADLAMAPVLPDLSCNATIMCCMVNSLTQPQLIMTTTHIPRTFAASSDFPRHAAAGSLHAHLLPYLRSWSWLQTLLMATVMFLLGSIIPGTCYPKE